MPVKRIFLTCVTAVLLIGQGAAVAQDVQLGTDLESASKAAQARQLVDELYGEAITKAKATRSHDDDVELAKTLLTAALSVDATEMQRVLLESAIELALSHGSGISTARDAFDELTRRMPQHRHAVQQEMIDQLTRLSTARDVHRGAVAMLYMEQLVDLSDSFARLGDTAQAINVLRRALAFSRSMQGLFNDDALNSRIDELREQQQVRQRIEQLRELAEAERATDAHLQELFALLIGDVNDVEAAGELLELPAIKSNPMRPALDAAIATPRQPDAASALNGGELLMRLQARAMTAGGKAALAQRARACYERYLALADQNDVLTAQVQLTLHRLDEIVAAAPAKDVAAPGRIIPNRRTHAPDERGMAVGKAVTAGSVADGHVPSRAVNGSTDSTDENNGWWGGKLPDYLQIDLGRPTWIDCIHVFPYVGNNRYYQYVVEVSVDNRKWELVGDMRKNTELSTPSGDPFVFAPLQARFVRVTVLHNSFNPYPHLTEVRVHAVAFE